MDPLSPVAILNLVTSVGGVVLKLSTKLHSFVKATKVVEKSVQELHREVQVLGNVLTTTEKALAKIIKDHAHDATLSVDGVWTSLKDAADDCRVTVEALDSIVNRIGVDGGNKNFFKKALKQVKLSLSTDQITAVKTNIHTHYINLQLALLTLDVSLSLSLRTDNKIIISKVDNLASAIAGARVAQSSEHTNLPVIFRNPDLGDHNRRLRRRADAALSNASTIIGIGSTQGEGTIYDPDSFSESGVPLSTAMRDRIEEWTQELDMDTKEFGSLSKYKKTNPTKVEKDPSLRIVKGILENAERSWAKADFHEAERFFRAGLNRAEALEKSKQQLLDLNNIHLKLAFTRLHQKDYFGAITLFHILLNDIQGPKGLLNSIRRKLAVTETALYRSHAYFGLAQAHLGKGSFCDAIWWCQKCNECWRADAQKKAHLLYSKGLQLMASIHRAQGDLIAANAFFEIAAQEGFETDKTTPYAFDFETVSAVFCVMRALREDIPIRAAFATQSLSRLAGCGGQFSRTEITATVNFLLDKGAKRNWPLMKACKCGNILVAEVLCRSGADVDDVDEDGETALMRASEDGRLGIVKVLCENGADKEAKAEDDLGTALYRAVSKRHTAVIDLLLKQGASANARDDNYETPLFYALWDLDIVRTLCAAGADVQAMNRDGESVLAQVLTYSTETPKHTRLEIVKTLCESGADVSAKLGSRSLLELARCCGQEFSDILKLYGAK